MVLLIAVLLSSCRNVSNNADALRQSQGSQPTHADSLSDQDTDKSESQTESNFAENANEEEDMLKIQIGDITLTAALEDNPSVDALKDLLADGPITITVQNYGGFEKIGTLPQRLPQNDIQTTAVPGDVMLYQGKSIVIFYGSNTWSYTKLGTISGFSRDELSKVLSGNDTTASLAMAPSANKD